MYMFMMVRKLFACWRCQNTTFQ